MRDEVMQSNQSDMMKASLTLLLKNLTRMAFRTSIMAVSVLTNVFSDCK